VRKFKAEFQGSEEEKLAVLAAYVTGEGDMDFLFEEVMLSDPVADEERFRAIIDHEIAEQRVEAYAAYVGETKAAKKRRRAKAEREARLAEEAARELGVDDKLFGNGTGKKGRKSADKNDQSGLAALIQTRQKERAADFFADLEAKYAPAPKKGKRRAVEEPPEEAFERTEKRRKRSKVVDDEEEAVPAPSPRKAKRVKA
jgi:DnaJ family protein C protein 9